MLKEEELMDLGLQLVFSKLYLEILPPHIDVPGINSFLPLRILISF